MALFRFLHRWPAIIPPDSSLAPVVPFLDDRDRELEDHLAYPWKPYTPTFSGTLGNGTVSGRYVEIGGTVHFQAGVTWGTTTAHAAATQTLTLPVPAASQIAHGTVTINQGGTGRKYHLDLPTTLTASGKSENDATITNLLPLAAWANGHYWVASGTYEKAE